MERNPLSMGLRAVYGRNGLNVAFLDDPELNRITLEITVSSHVISSTDANGTPTVKYKVSEESKKEVIGHLEQFGALFLAEHPEYEIVNQAQAVRDENPGTKDFKTVIGITFQKKRSELRFQVRTNDLSFPSPSDDEQFRFLNLSLDLSIDIDTEIPKRLLDAARKTILQDHIPGSGTPEMLLEFIKNHSAAKYPLLGFSNHELHLKRESITPNFAIYSFKIQVPDAILVSGQVMIKPKLGESDPAQALSELLRKLETEPSIGTSVKLLDNAAVHIDFDSFKANAYQITLLMWQFRKVLAAKELFFEDGLSYLALSEIPEFYLEQSDALILLAVGSLAGWWKIEFPRIKEFDAGALQIETLFGDTNLDADSIDIQIDPESLKQNQAVMEEDGISPEELRAAVIFKALDQINSGLIDSAEETTVTANFDTTLPSKLGDARYEFKMTVKANNPNQFQYSIYKNASASIFGLSPKGKSKEPEEILIASGTGSFRSELRTHKAYFSASQESDGSIWFKIGNEMPEKLEKPKQLVAMLQRYHIELSIVKTASGGKVKLAYNGITRDIPLEDAGQLQDSIRALIHDGDELYSKLLLGTARFYTAQGQAVKFQTLLSRSGVSQPTLERIAHQDPEVKRAIHFATDRKLPSSGDVDHLISWLISKKLGEHNPTSVRDQIDSYSKQLKHKPFRKKEGATEDGLIDIATTVLTDPAKQPFMDIILRSSISYFLGAADTEEEGKHLLTSLLTEVYANELLNHRFDTEPAAAAVDARSELRSDESSLLSVVRFLTSGGNRSTRKQPVEIPEGSVSEFRGVRGKAIPRLSSDAPDTLFPRLRGPMIRQGSEYVESTPKSELRAATQDVTSLSTDAATNPGNRFTIRMNKIRITAQTPGELVQKLIRLDIPAELYHGHKVAISPRFSNIQSFPAFHMPHTRMSPQEAEWGDNKQLSVLLNFNLNTYLVNAATQVWGEHPDVTVDVKETSESALITITGDFSIINFENENEKFIKDRIIGVLFALGIEARETKSGILIRVNANREAEVPMGVESTRTLLESTIREALTEIHKKYGKEEFQFSVNPYNPRPNIENSQYQSLDDLLKVFHGFASQIEENKKTAEGIENIAGALEVVNDKIELMLNLVIPFLWNSIFRDKDFDIPYTKSAVDKIKHWALAVGHLHRELVAVAPKLKDQTAYKSALTSIRNLSSTIVEATMYLDSVIEPRETFLRRARERTRFQPPVDLQLSALAALTEVLQAGAYSIFFMSEMVDSPQHEDLLRSLGILTGRYYYSIAMIAHSFASSPNAVYRQKALESLAKTLKLVSDANWRIMESTLRSQSMPTDKRDDVIDRIKQMRGGLIAARGFIHSNQTTDPALQTDEVQNLLQKIDSTIAAIGKLGPLLASRSELRTVGGKQDEPIPSFGAFFINAELPFYPGKIVGINQEGQRILAEAAKITPPIRDPSKTRGAMDDFIMTSTPVAFVDNNGFAVAADPETEIGKFLADRKAKILALYRELMADLAPYVEKPIRLALHNEDSFEPPIHAPGRNFLNFDLSRKVRTNIFHVRPGKPLDDLVAASDTSGMISSPLAIAPLSFIDSEGVMHLPMDFFTYDDATGLIKPLIEQAILAAIAPNSIRLQEMLSEHTYDLLHSDLFSIPKSSELVQSFTRPDMPAYLSLLKMLAEQHGNFIARNPKLYNKKTYEPMVAEGSAEWELITKQAILEKIGYEVNNWFADQAKRDEIIAQWFPESVSAQLRKYIEYGRAPKWQDVSLADWYLALRNWYALWLLMQHAPREEPEFKLDTAAMERGAKLRGYIERKHIEPKRLFQKLLDRRVIYLQELPLSYFDTINILSRTIPEKGSFLITFPAHTLLSHNINTLSSENWSINEVNEAVNRYLQTGNLDELENSLPHHLRKTRLDELKKDGDEGMLRIANEMRQTALATIQKVLEPLRSLIKKGVKIHFAADFYDEHVTAESSGVPLNDDQMAKLAEAHIRNLEAKAEQVKADHIIIIEPQMSLPGMKSSHLVSVAWRKKSRSDIDRFLTLLKNQFGDANVASAGILRESIEASGSIWADAYEGRDIPFLEWEKTGSPLTKVAHFALEAPLESPLAETPINEGDEGQLYVHASFPDGLFVILEKYDFGGGDEVSEPVPQDSDLAPVGSGTGDSLRSELRNLTLPDGNDFEDIRRRTSQYVDGVIAAIEAAARASDLESLAGFAFAELNRQIETHGNEEIRNFFEQSKQRINSAERRRFETLSRSELRADTELSASRERIQTWDSIVKQAEEIWRKQTDILRRKNESTKKPFPERLDEPDSFPVGLTPNFSNPNSEITRLIHSQLGVDSEEKMIALWEEELKQLRAVRTKDDLLALYNRFTAKPMSNIAEAISEINAHWNGKQPDAIFFTDTSNWDLNGGMRLGSAQVSFWFALGPVREALGITELFKSVVGLQSTLRMPDGTLVKIVTLRSDIEGDVVVHEIFHVGQFERIHPKIAFIGKDLFLYKLLVEGSNEYLTETFIDRYFKNILRPHHAYQFFVSVFRTIAKVVGDEKIKLFHQTGDPVYLSVPGKLDFPAQLRAFQNFVQWLRSEWISKNADRFKAIGDKAEALSYHDITDLLNTSSIAVNNAFIGNDPHSFEQLKPQMQKLIERKLRHEKGLINFKRKQSVKRVPTRTLLKRANTAFNLIRKLADSGKFLNYREFLSILMPSSFKESFRDEFEIPGLKAEQVPTDNDHQRKILRAGFRALYVLIEERASQNKVSKALQGLEDQIMKIAAELHSRSRSELRSGDEIFEGHDADHTDPQNGTFEIRPGTRFKPAKDVRTISLAPNHTMTVRPLKTHQRTLPSLPDLEPIRTDAPAVRSELRKMKQDAFAAVQTSLNQYRSFEPRATNETKSALSHELGIDLTDSSKLDQTQILGLLPNIANDPAALRAIVANVSGKNKIIIFTGTHQIDWIKEILSEFKPLIDSGRVVITDRTDDSAEILKGVDLNAKLLALGLTDDEVFASLLKRELTGHVEVEARIVSDIHQALGIIGVIYQAAQDLKAAWLTAVSA